MYLIPKHKELSWHIPDTCCRTGQRASKSIGREQLLVLRVFIYSPHQLALVEMPSNLATMYCTMEPSPRSPPHDDDDEAEEDEGDSALSIGVSASA